jgi:endonuclease YncB( thermonuclease family)
MISAVLFCAVVGISDGDTLKARCDADGSPTTLTVRLSEIDAPEKGQPFGQRSRQQLSKLCFHKAVEIRPTARDRYGRTVARVTCEGADANAAMVRSGMAWAYTRYLTDPQIRAMEVLAQREHIGIWSEADAVQPWKWQSNRGHRVPR